MTARKVNVGTNTKPRCTRCDEEIDTHGSNFRAVSEFGQGAEHRRRVLLRTRVVHILCPTDPRLRP